MSSDKKLAHAKFISLQDGDESSINHAKLQDDEYSINFKNTMTLKIELHKIINDFDISLSRENA